MSAEISESSTDVSPAAETNGMMPFWMQFFHDAGIPSADIENYSIMFINHRIQRHMLMDLNKEYLVEMGITAMGDIIAILKQAKVLNSKPLREVAQKMKPTSSDAPAPETPLQRRLRLMEASERSSTTAATRSTPVSRIVGHYLGNDPEARLMSDNTPPKIPSVSPELAKRLSGTSTDSANRKSSVFSRLGNAAAASASLSTASSAYGRLGFQDNKAANIQVTINSASSQISDLRGVLKRPATTTCRDSDDSDSADSACEYAGVLKKSSATWKKKRKLSRRVRTSSQASSANVPSEGIFSVRAKSQSASVKQRLGQK